MNKKAAAFILSFLMIVSIIDFGPGTKKALAFDEIYGESSYSEITASTAAEIDAVFPASYTAALKKLLSEHPKWKFRAFYTGMKWEECFDGSFHRYGYEYLNGEEYGVSELFPECNLAEHLEDKGSLWYLPTSWFSVTIGDSFDWENNKWKILSMPDFVQASEEAIRYCMDVRNFFTEEQIFQFEDQSVYQASLTEVKKILSDVSKNASGIYYWMQPAEKTGITSTYKRKTAVSLTYAEAICEIGKRLNINPAIMAARIILEQGVGDSPMISGTKAFTVTKGANKGKKISGGYYNYFNIDATDADEETASPKAVYNNGLTEAYYAGWDTRYRAIYGGAKKLKQNYVENDQQTFYMQKFNVNASSPGCMITQYMQSVTTPQLEAKKAYNAYSAGNTLDCEHVFVIPVFLEMPKTVYKKPVKDGNPNYKLGSIALNGTEVNGFDTDLLNYTAANVKAGTSSVLLGVHAYAPTSKITVGKLSDKGDFSKKITLNHGKNTFSIVCTSEYGTKRTYKLNIFRCLSAPASIAAVPYKTGLKVTFIPSEAAEGYTIQRKVSDGSFESITPTLKTDADGNLYFYDSGLKTGTVYTYRVRAWATDFSKTKKYSSYRTSLAVTAVRAVTGVRTERYKSGFKISFKGTSGADGYEVQRKSGSGSYKTISVKIGKTSDGLRYFTNASLTTGRKYRYRIKAYTLNPDGTKNYSANTYTETVTAIRRVGGLKAVNTASGIQLTWDKVEGATGYIIERKSGSGSFKKIKTITSADTLKYTNTKITEGTVYQYRISAYFGTSETAGLPNETVSICYAEQPEVISVKALSGGDIRISLTPDAKVTQYQIQYADNEQFKNTKSVTVKNPGTDPAVIRFTPEKKGTVYVRVRARIKKDGIYWYSVYTEKSKITVK